MDVKELVWWWDQGWRAWARQNGIDLDAEPEGAITTPDREAFRRAYPKLRGGVVSR